MIPRLAIYGIAGAVIAAGVLGYGHSRYKAGKAAEHALWAADTAARDKAAAEAIAAQKAAELAAQAHNQEIQTDANTKLAAIAADRDNLSGMLRRADDRIRSLAAAKATGDLGISVATGIATRAEEARRAIETQYDVYDRACQRDAVRFQALQDQIRPQL